MPAEVGLFCISRGLDRDVAGEQTNLTTARPDVVARLKAKVAAWDKGNVPPQWTSMRQSVRRVEGELVKIYP